MATNAPTSGKNPLDALLSGASDVLSQIDSTLQTGQNAAVTDMTAVEKALFDTVQSTLNATRAALDGTVKGAAAVTKAAKNKL